MDGQEVIKNQETLLKIFRKCKNNENLRLSSSPGNCVDFLLDIEYLPFQ